jgi:hypothetical protein
MLKNKISASLIAGGMALVGLIAGVATMASAQSATTTNAPATVTSSTSSSQVDTPESPNDPADTATGSTMHGHAPLGGDGVISSINGSTIIMGEESNEGGASYTVDASKATVTNNGAAATLADIKVGDKIFVQGPVTGTSVAATSVSLGHSGGHMEKANDTDGGAASEASEPAGSASSTDQ